MENKEYMRASNWLRWDWVITLVVHWYLASCLADLCSKSMQPCSDSSTSLTINNQATHCRYSVIPGRHYMDLSQHCSRQLPQKMPWWAVTVLLAGCRIFITTHMCIWYAAQFRDRCFLLRFLLRFLRCFWWLISVQWSAAAPSNNIAGGQSNNGAASGNTAS